MTRLITPLRPTGTTFVAVILLGISLFLMWHTFSPVYDTAFATSGRGPVFFPHIILGIMIAFAVLVAGQSLTQAGGGMTWRRLVPVAAAAVVTAVYVFLITAIGYLFATLAFGFVLPLVFGYRRYVVTAVFATVYAGTTWYMFEMIFRIILPKSPWFAFF